MELVQDTDGLREAFGHPGFVRLGHVRADKCDLIRIPALGYYPVPDVPDGLYIVADHTAYRGVILVSYHGDVVLAMGALDLVDEQRMRGRQLLAGLPFLDGLMEDIGDDMLPDLAGSGCRGHGLLRQGRDDIELEELGVCMVGDNERTSGLGECATVLAMELRYRDAHVRAHRHDRRRIVDCVHPLVDAHRPSAGGTFVAQAVLHGYIHGHAAQIYGVDGVGCEIQHWRIGIGIGECSENPLVDGYTDDIPTGGIKTQCEEESEIGGHDRIIYEFVNDQLQSPVLFGNYG